MSGDVRYWPCTMDGPGDPPPCGGRVCDTCPIPMLYPMAPDYGAMSTAAALRLLAREVLVPSFEGRRLSPGQRVLEVVAGAPVRVGAYVLLVGVVAGGAVLDRLPEYRVAAWALGRRAGRAWQGRR